MPGAALLAIGLVISIISLTQLAIFGRAWNLHTLIGGELLCVVGVQIVALGLCAHAYGTYFMAEKDPWFDRMRARYRLEHGLMLGGAIMLAGFVAAATIIGIWINRGFGALSEERLAGDSAAALIIIGLQIFFSSFLLSILGLRRRDS